MRKQFETFKKGTKFTGIDANEISTAVYTKMETPIPVEIILRDGRVHTEYINAIDNYNGRFCIVDPKTYGRVVK